MRLIIIFLQLLYQKEEWLQLVMVKSEDLLTI